jgi:hypothetical protein
VRFCTAWLNAFSGRHTTSPCTFHPALACEQQQQQRQQQPSKGRNRKRTAHQAQKINGGTTLQLVCCQCLAIQPMARTRTELPNLVGGQVGVPLHNRGLMFRPCLLLSFRKIRSLKRAS